MLAAADARRGEQQPQRLLGQALDDDRLGQRRCLGGWPPRVVIEA